MGDGFSVTFRHDRFKHGGAAGVVRHSIRSVEEKHGIYRNHSNEKIDPKRTAANTVLVNDGQGGFKEAETVREVHDYRRRLVNKRKDTRKLRDNQISHMETLVQLDGDFAGTAVEFLNDSRGTADESRRLLQVLTDHVVDMVGQERINYIALHVDETSPHVHIGWTPLAEDGSLEYRKVIGDTYIDKTGKSRGLLTKKMLSDQQKDVRQLMNDNGYPAVEVFSSPKHEKHEVYKRQQQNLEIKFAERENDIKQREDKCDLREYRVSRREQTVKDEKSKLETERDDFAQEMDKQRQELDTQRRQHQEAVRKQKEDFDKREKALKEKTEADQQKLSNERDAMLTEVQERKDSLGERENSVQQWEERQVKTRKAVAKFMNSRYFTNAMKYPMDMPREQSDFVKAVSDLYADIRPTGLEPTHSTPSDRARSRSEATTSRAKPRTPTKHVQRRKPDIVREMEEARAKKNKGGGDSPDY